MLPLWAVLAISILCDALLGWFMYASIDHVGGKIENVDTKIETVDTKVESKVTNWRVEMENKVEDWEEAHKEMLKKAHEGNVWLIRYDLNRMMDLYEVRGVITSKEYTRLHDEYLYYTNTLKGNHGIQERWDEFTAKLHTGEVKMTK